MTYVARLAARYAERARRRDAATAPGARQKLPRIPTTALRPGTTKAFAGS
jgi:hypothetical protein